LALPKLDVRSDLDDAKSPSTAATIRCPEELLELAGRSVGLSQGSGNNHTLRYIPPPQISMPPRFPEGRQHFLCKAAAAMQQDDGRISVIARFQEMQFASVDDLVEARKRGVWLPWLHCWQTGLLRAGSTFVRKRIAA
jgi:hypothetical protein